MAPDNTLNHNGNNAGNNAVKKPGKSTIETDVAIIGAGPVGLFAIFELGMLKIRAHVIDSLSEPGGQCAALYPEKPIYDIPGYPRIDAGELVDNLMAQAEPFHPVYHLDQQVTTMQHQPDDRILLETDAGTSLLVKAVIIAAGAGAFGPNKPPLDGLDEYEGKSVFYWVRRRADFTGRRIVIAGGGDSAVDWALSLSDVAEKLWLVHRRDKFRAAPDSVEKLRKLAAEGKVEMMIPGQLAALKGANGTLEQVVIKDLENNETALNADTLLPFYGLATNLGPINNWGLSVTRHHININPATCETSAKGVYAIGDIASYENKLKLILTGFSEAAMAAHAIRHQLHPDEALHFEYSTTSGIPGAGA